MIERSEAARPEARREQQDLYSAAAVVLTELAAGRTAAEARALGPGDVISALGGLPERKEGCALMAVGALRAALVDAQVRARA